MPRVRVEFTVEPFREGRLGGHVEAALLAFREGGFSPDVGPFSTTVDGDLMPVLSALARATEASFGSGASGMTVSVRAATGGEPGDDAQSFLAALRPVARALGARVVPPERVGEGIVPLNWRGRVVGGLERPEPSDMRDALGKLVDQVEQELGGPFATLSRVDKQRAVRLLDDRGAFALRNAVDEVADAMGVSRVTVYNYLNATRSPADD
ncbi:MAG: helix-turn-helix domain-containing protein [Acidimicrobiales bacterium]